MWYNREKGSDHMTQVNFRLEEDVKNNADVYTIEDNKIVFEDGTIYTYTDNDIYRNKIKITVDFCRYML